ncbi:hypothetical protein HPP92_016236 [Vanilla planifolia]|uniref:G-protein coupled receptors family 2 profile 2 domain-containing protein n=1 Tax=Vanilla planifolia TaxID=51239 RepID=A0A835QAK6_VANPL|nr:hypothetical protein HPP92_016236 [Vanilla planifolia]
MAAASGGLSASDRRILSAFSTTAAALSLSGSTFIVLCYVFFKELRKFSFRLVFFLALSDMFCSFFSIVGDPSNELFCYAQDYSAHFFCLASFCGPQQLHSHFIVLLSNTNLMWKISDLFFIYMFGVAHVITFYAPLWGAILYNGFTYYQVTRMLSNATRMAVGMGDRSYQFDAGAGRKAVNKWGYYPLILIGSWAFATINRIFDFLHPGHKIFWLSLADVWFAGLMGLFNSIAYGLNSAVRRAIAERIDMYFPEKLKRLLPQRFKVQQEQELAALFVEG